MFVGLRTCLELFGPKFILFGSVQMHWDDFGGVRMVLDIFMFA